MQAQVKKQIKDAVADAQNAVADVSNKVVSQVAGNEEHREGPLAKAIEKQTAKLPSDVFLWAAVGSVAVSAGLQAAQRKKASLFVGQWVAPLLLLGVYNKIVKVAGSDQQTR